MPPSPFRPPKNLRFLYNEYMIPQLVIFDMDGTLTESKSVADTEMVELLRTLLQKTTVAVISGGAMARFEEQLLVSFLGDTSHFENFYLATLNGGILYSHKGVAWEKIYEEVLSDDEKQKIADAFKKTFEETGFKPEATIYGMLIEDRGGQVTFSGLGSEAPLELKKMWDPDRTKRTILVEELKKHLPEFEVRMGGTTSIDISHKGIDKAYGVEKLSEHLSISISEMLFIGDALYPGGNDEAAKRTGIETREVVGPEDTKKIIKELLKS